MSARVEGAPADSAAVAAALAAGTAAAVLPPFHPPTCTDRFAELGRVLPRDGERNEGGGACGG